MTDAISQTRSISSEASDAGACVGCQAEIHAARCHECGAAQSVHGYRTLRVIARTPHSRVYLAENEHGRKVALKELLFAEVPDADAIAAFEREAGMLRQLDHPSIPKFIETFQEGRGPGLRLYLAQEFIAGETLLARLERGPASYHDAEEIARDALDILEYLHSQPRPVFHRDVKPQNLIRRPSGELVLVDFGTARETSAAGTHGATLVGTFGYMPFEQLGGSINASTDLYALGATLIHLITGKSPADLFQPDGTLEFESEILDPRWRKFLRQLVARNPAGRFSSAAAARDALSSMARSSPERPHRAFAQAELLPREELGEETPPRTLRNRLKEMDSGPIKIVVAAVVIAVGLGLYLPQTFPSNPTDVTVTERQWKLGEGNEQGADLLFSAPTAQLRKTSYRVELDLALDVTNRSDSARALEARQMPQVFSRTGQLLKAVAAEGDIPDSFRFISPHGRWRWRATYGLLPSDLPLTVQTPAGKLISIDFGRPPYER